LSQDDSGLFYMVTAEQMAAVKAGTNELYVGFMLIINSPITLRKWEATDVSTT
jgi:hypothetical protein